MLATPTCIYKTKEIIFSHAWKDASFLFCPGDKSIDENEFCNVCRYHGIAEAEAREAFKKLGVVSANSLHLELANPIESSLCILYRVRKLPGINSPTSGSNISPRTSRPQPGTLFSEKLPSNSLLNPRKSQPTILYIIIH